MDGNYKPVKVAGTEDTVFLGEQSVRKIMSLGLEDALRRVITEGQRKGQVKESKILGRLKGYKPHDERFEGIVHTTLYPLASEIFTKYGFQKNGLVWEYLKN